MCRCGGMGVGSIQTAPWQLSLLPCHVLLWAPNTRSRAPSAATHAPVSTPDVPKANPPPHWPNKPHNNDNDNGQVLARLGQYLPEGHRSAAELRALARSAPFQQQLAAFSAALQSGQLDLAQFGLRAEGFGAADFARALEELVERERREAGGGGGGGAGGGGGGAGGEGAAQ